jgi:hypothetical protein
LILKRSFIRLDNSDCRSSSGWGCQKIGRIVETPFQIWLRVDLNLIKAFVHHRLNCYPAGREGPIFPALRD